MSFIKVDFPEPETPVIETKSPNGISTSISLRLFSDASSTTSVPELFLILYFDLND